jgi:fatty acid hydroxylase domain-containing protein 2
VLAIYAHPIEHVISNLTPVVLGSLLLRAPFSSSWMFFTFTQLNTLCDHSGYHLPFLHSPQFHDWHHLKFNECYGAMNILDRLHGTSAKFGQTIQYMRHKTLFTFKSADEVYPDVQKKIK